MHCHGMYEAEYEYVPGRFGTRSITAMLFRQVEERIAVECCEHRINGHSNLIVTNKEEAILQSKLMGEASVMRQRSAYCG